MMRRTANGSAHHGFSRLRVLLRRNRYIIHKEISWLILVVIGSLEEQRHLLSSVGVQQPRYVEGFNNPVVRRVEITTLLHVPYQRARSGLQAATKFVLAFPGIFVGIRVPPVGQGELRVTGRHGKGLRNAIGTTWIAAQVGTVRTRMRVQALNNLIAARR